MSDPVLPGEGPMTDEELAVAQGFVRGNLATGLDGQAVVELVRRLLDEVQRLRGESDRQERRFSMEKLHRESSKRQRENLERKLISWREAAEEARSECAALAAKVEAVQAENARYLQIINEITADNAGLTACLDAVHRVAEQPDRDWQRLSERMPEYFKPVDAEERARRTGWNQGVALFRDQLRAALETSGMPRPAAEETQERPETPGTGSGRGTGVAEASGTAQAGDLLDDLTPWGYEPLTPRQVDAAKRALRPVHYREAAASIRALADDPVWAWGPAHREGMHHAADHLDAVACDEAPSLPVEEGP